MIFQWLREPAVLRSAVTSGPDSAPGSTSLRQKDTTGYWPTAASRVRWQTTPPRPHRVNTRHCTKIELYRKKPEYPERTDTGTHSLLAGRRHCSKQKQNLKPLTKLHTITLVSVTSLFTLLFSFSLLFFRLAILYRNFCWGTRSTCDINDAPCLLRVFTHWPQLDHKAPICLVYVLFYRPQAARKSARSVRCELFEYSVMHGASTGVQDKK